MAGFNPPLLCRNLGLFRIKLKKKKKKGCVPARVAFEPRTDRRAGGHLGIWDGLRHFREFLLGMLMTYVNWEALGTRDCVGGKLTIKRRQKKEARSETAEPSSDPSTMDPRQ